MLFLDGVYAERPDGCLRFRWVKAPTSAELVRLTETLALRIGRYLERQGLLERDAENSYLVGDELEVGPLDQLLGSSITYHIAVGPQQGRKVFTLQTRPACDGSFDDGGGTVAGFSCTPASWCEWMNARGSNGCVFRLKLDTDSGSKWTAIPDQTGHPFRCKLDSDSGLKLDTFPVISGIDQAK